MGLREIGGWIRRRPFASAALALPFVMAADYNLASWADQRIRARDADFHERYRPGIIDWNGPYEQLCEYKFELLIYIYRTCFSVYGKNEFANFKYWEPLPIFYRGFWALVDHYFEAVELSDTYFIINKDGTVERFRSSGER